MVAGHLREQNGYFQMILSWKDSKGKRRSKSISTGLPIKGNKKRAEAMLLKAREEFNLENLIENANVPLCDFFQKWLKDRAISMGARVYANYAYDVKAYIAPYFRENPVSVLKVTPKELEAFYRFERQEDDATPEDLLQYHEAVTACLGYAEELGWIEENPAEEVNPCADQAPILFDEFIREWLEIIRSKIGEITYASYKRNVEKCIAPYFKARRYTLQDLERHPKYIQEFYQSMLDSGLSPSTVIRRHANVRKCLQYAFQIGLIKSNPADRVEKPRKIKYEATIYNEEELNILFKTVKGDPLELAVIVGAFYGLRRSEVVGLKWDAIDFKKKTISIRHTVVQFNLDGQNQIVRKDSTKTKSSCRTLPLVPPFELLLRHLKEEQSINQKICGDCYCRDYLEYIYVDAMGNLIRPNFITQHFRILLEKKELNCGEVKYLLQPIECGDKSEIHTVREWFGDFDVSLEDTAFVHWNQAMSVISMELKELEMQLDMMVMMSLWLTVRIALYENYSSTEEFLPQFDANVEDIIKLLDDIPKLKEMVNNGRKP